MAQGLLDFINKPDKRKQPFIERDNHPQKIGKTFEAEIQQTCDVYESLKLAYIQQTPIPILCIHGRTIFRKKMGFDFSGVIVEPRNGIFLECKSTKEGSIPVGEDKFGIKKHQLDIMLWLEEIGAICYFLWKVRSVDLVYKLIPSKIVELSSRKGKLMLIDCDEAHIPRMIKTKYNNGLYYDFMNYLDTATGAG